MFYLAYHYLPYKTNQLETLNHHPKLHSEIELNFKKALALFSELGVMGLPDEQELVKLNDKEYCVLAMHLYSALPHFIVKPNILSFSCYLSE